MVSVSKKTQYYIHVDDSLPLTPDSRVEVNASGSISP